MPYSGDPSASDEDKVRFYIGDTNEPPILLDAEVSFLLEEHGTPLRAAWVGALSIAALYSKKSNKTIGSMTVDYADLTRRFTELAASLAKRGGFSTERGTVAPIAIAGTLDKESIMDVDWHNRKMA